MPDISVVIPTYNRLHELRFVLPSLLAQDLPAQRYELLICDSHSSDGTAEYLAGMREQAPNLRHLPGAYSGRGAARNAGIAAASGRIVQFNDSDIIASPDLLRRHLERHEAAPHIAVVGLEVQVKTYEDYERKRDRPELRDPLHKPTRKRLPWLYFLTGNASVEREDLLRVGSFDEDFTGYGHEDLELGYRLERAGIPIYYEPLAVNYHLQDIPHDDQVEKMKLAGRSSALFYRKHPHFAVMANLGMTPLSLGLHSALSHLPWVLGYFNRQAQQPGFARSLIQQYYYVSGIKSALHPITEGDSGARG